MARFRLGMLIEEPCISHIMTQSFKHPMNLIDAYDKNSVYRAETHVYGKMTRMYNIILVHSSRDPILEVSQIFLVLLRCLKV